MFLHEHPEVNRLLTVVVDYCTYPPAFSITTAEDDVLKKSLLENAANDRWTPTVKKALRGELPLIVACIMPITKYQATCEFAEYTQPV